MVSDIAESATLMKQYQRAVLSRHTSDLNEPGVRQSQIKITINKVG